MSEALTGRAAHEALGAYMRLGRSGARFDAARVARAARTPAGRASLAAALSRPLARLCRAVRGREARMPARRARAPQRRACRVVTPPGQPARPRAGTAAR